MKILLVNNQGAGDMDWKEIGEGTTVGQMISDNVGSADSYLVRVNREQVSNDYILKNEDRVTVTPTNIEGA